MLLLIVGLEDVEQTPECWLVAVTSQHSCILPNEAGRPIRPPRSGSVYSRLALTNRLVLATRHQQSEKTGLAPATQGH